MTPPQASTPVADQRGGHSPSELRPFSDSLPMALLKAREAAMRRFRPTLGAHDLTEQQWRVLRALNAATEPIDATELAERTFLLAPSLSRILVNLNDRRLITRAGDPADQRRTLIALSSRGSDQVATIAPKSEARYAEIEAGFGQARLQSLLTELHAFAAVFPDPEGTQG